MVLSHVLVIGGGEVLHEPMDHRRNGTCVAMPLAFTRQCRNMPRCFSKPQTTCPTPTALCTVSAITVSLTVRYPSMRADIA